MNLAHGLIAADCWRAHRWPRAPSRTGDIAIAMSKIKPLFKPKTRLQPGDWLADAQGTRARATSSFARSRPNPPASKYSTLRLVPIGPLSDGQAGSHAT